MYRNSSRYDYMRWILPNMNVNNLLKVVQRFPLPLITIVLSSCIAIVHIQVKHDDVFYIHILSKLMPTTVLLFVFFLCVDLFSESKGNKVLRWILSGLGIILSILYYYNLSDRFYVYDYHFAPVFFGLFLALHLLISVVPFIGHKKEISFWEYNRVLITNLFQSAVYTFFLFISMMLAILAVQNLFGLEINEETLILQLWVFLVGIFHSFYFLSNFPKDIKNIELQQPPKSYVIFSEYVMLPIAFLYLLILYAYFIKIGVLWELPKGWVSKLVLSFSGLGMLGYLLNFGLPSQDKNKHVTWYKKYFYYLLIVPIILLFLAIYTRISAYGVTVPRYVIAIMASWLICIMLYFIISKRDDIRWIPISLVIFILLGLFSPLNMFQVTAKSQIKRLNETLSKAGMLIDNTLHKVDTVDQETYLSLTSQIDQIHRLKQINHLQTYGSEEIDLTMIDTFTYGKYMYKEQETIYDALGMNAPNFVDFHRRNIDKNYYVESPGTIVTHNNTGVRTIEASQQEYIDLTYGDFTIHNEMLYYKDDNSKVDTISTKVILDNLPKEIGPQKAFLSYTLLGKRHTYYLYLEHLSINRNKHVNYLRGLMFIE